MANATTNQDRKMKADNGKETQHPVKASTKIPAGVICAVEASSGLLVNGGDTAGLVLPGISAQMGDNSSGSNGDVKIRVRRDEVAAITYSGAAGNYGANVYIVDNQTVTADATATTNDIVLGKAVLWDTTNTLVWVAIPKA